MTLHQTERLWAGGMTLCLSLPLTPVFYLSGCLLTYLIHLYIRLLSHYSLLHFI